MIHHDKLSSYERTAQKLLKGQPKPRPIARFIDGKLLTGTQSLHRTKQSRTWRLFWRLKHNRGIQYGRGFATSALTTVTAEALEKARTVLQAVQAQYNHEAITEAASRLPDVAVEIGKSNKWLKENA